jgi:pimeloyl-ACP methyl ester carboxylesterase
MRARRTVLTAIATAAAGGAAWEAQRRRDRVRVETDPEFALLHRPLRGRAQTVVSGDGTELHVEVFGDEDAPTIVLAHGWTCQIRFWTRQIHTLSESFRVVAYDQRGHGASGRAADDDYRIERFGHDLAAVLEQCVPEGRPALVAGHSLGGMSIVSFAGLHMGEVHDRIAAAALVNTGMGDLIAKTLILPVRTPVAKVEQAIGSAVLSAPLPLPSGPTPLAHRVVKYVALSRDATPAQIGFSEELVVDCRPDVRGAVGGALSRLDLHAAVRRLAVPTIVIAGERDKLTPPEHAERLHAELPQPAGLVRLPGGHMGPIEHADEVSAALRDLAAAHIA